MLELTRVLSFLPALQFTSAVMSCQYTPMLCRHNCLKMHENFHVISSVDRMLSLQQMTFISTNQLQVEMFLHFQIHSNMYDQNPSITSHVKDKLSQIGSFTIFHVGYQSTSGMNHATVKQEPLLEEENFLRFPFLRGYTQEI